MVRSDNNIELFDNISKKMSQDKTLNCQSMKKKEFMSIE
ncbi:hypothetical protein SITYG_11920 [Streptococcus intermedius]|uniref:Uncharacterized protein n=1 Tax=Streptococcus intermedius TaxID=1338 RepID=A0AAD1C8C1_STRIT|nr:hypothetical protein SITYG_11920 [Streptococcus intermedius]